MKWLRRILLVLLVLVVAFLIFFFGFAPSYIEKSLNPVINKPPYQVSEKAQQLHEKLIVADLHADALLWNREPFGMKIRRYFAQVDVPKLLRRKRRAAGFYGRHENSARAQISNATRTKLTIFSGSRSPNANRSKIFRASRNAPFTKPNKLKEYSR